ncbi:MAG: YbaK/EbsC family protein [Veillonellaceae bacterium]|jgi:Cys-tRNA(Pro) deacylase|nr:YbaK/EbsC family protein [Veillonellaceae bacterium]
MYSTNALQRVQNFIEKYSDLRIILFDSSTHTSELAAQALGVTVGQIAKTLVFTAESKPYLVVTCGDKKVNTKKLSHVLNVKKVKFASAEVVKEFTGFLPGGVSPVGLASSLPIFLDKSLFEYDVVFAAAGTSNSALPVAPSRLQQITGGTVIDVC